MKGFCFEERGPWKRNLSAERIKAADEGLFALETFPLNELKAADEELFALEREP